MNKNDNMYGESREQENEMQNNPRTNANTNDLLSLIHISEPTRH